MLLHGSADSPSETSIATMAIAAAPRAPSCCIGTSVVQWASLGRAVLLIRRPDPKPFVSTFLVYGASCGTRNLRSYPDKSLDIGWSETTKSEATDAPKNKNTAPE